MGYYELIQENPTLLIFILIFSLVLTLVVYGAFPIIFSKVTKTPISKKKYKLLCYGINFIGIILFTAFDGGASAGPYLLWTWIFSNNGIRRLETRNLLSDTLSYKVKNKERHNDFDEIRFCRKCGIQLNANSRFCHKCGTEIKEVKQ